MGWFTVTLHHGHTARYRRGATWTTPMRLALAAVALPLLFIGHDVARADECSDLWFGRNQVYKAAGYCFKTARAIAAFGNAGCQYDDIRDVPLSERDRVVVGRYVREEAVLGCQP